MENFEAICKRISNNIKYYRKVNHITQSKLSELTGISQSTISDYENEKKMSLSVLFQISKALNISINELLFSDELSIKNSISFPVSKFINQTYFCYYIKNSSVKHFKMKIFNYKSPHNANIKIKFANLKIWLTGELYLDDKLAVVIMKIPEKNKHYILTFNYFHDSANEKYLGGVALFQTINAENNSPQIQFCVISNKELDDEKLLNLKYMFLNLESGCDNSKSFCGPEVKENLDEKFFYWINDNYQSQEL